MRATFFKIFISLCLFFVLMSSCSEFFEEDITEKTVNLIAPGDYDTTQMLQHTFWWNYVEDAEGYNLLIVTPSFDAVQYLVLDTNITTDQFTHTLDPGTYEWGVSAYNYSSSTEYSIRSLVIDTSSVLTNQVVNVFAPENNLITNVSEIQFRWQKVLEGADYTITIKKEDWNGALFDIIETKTLSVTLKLPEGEYAWGIQAENAHSESRLSVQNFTVDITAPSVPILKQPNFGDTVAPGFVFEWSRFGDNSTALSDSIFISQDSLFVNIVEQAVVPENTYQVATNKDGTYFWRVRTIDAAGNGSNFSSTGKFTFAQ